MKLLDLYTGGGGCAWGYHLAGFTVTGVDIFPQKNYPFPDRFILRDAINLLKDISFCKKFDVIHASPVCKHYSAITPKSKRNDHPDDIPLIRSLLKKIGRPYVIENVPGSPLINYVVLDGSMFGLKVKRRRLFECVPEIYFPPIDGGYVGSYGRVSSSFDLAKLIGVYGKSFKVEDARIAMGINWMSGKQLSQAIPPAYTEWIGRRMMENIVS